MKLYATDMFFRGDTDKDKAYDCCIHGKVVFTVGEESLCDNSEWCVSASAFRFLHTLFENHFTGAEDFLIPCCGHFMVPSEDKQSVIISGCNSGIDFDIIHEQENIIIKTKEKEYSVKFEDYKSAVITFAKQIENFYKTNPQRKFENDFDKDGFSAFINEWYFLFDKVPKENTTPEITTITFDDYDICSEASITSISENGISLNPFGFINFKECAYNFNKTHGGSGKCIGERNIENLSFSFYTSPKPIEIKFITKKKLFEFFSKENTISRFHKLQKQIEKYGYTTRDMT